MRVDPRTRHFFVCDGSCGAPACQYKARSASELRKHQQGHTSRRPCPHCGARITNVPRHIRLKHPDKAPPPRPRLRCPFPDDRFGWNFVHRKGSRLLHQYSLRIAKWSPTDAEYTRRLRRDRTGARREICIAVYKRCRPATDSVIFKKNNKTD